MYGYMMGHILIELESFLGLRNLDKLLMDKIKEME
jgi:hypothetical protein